jgi:hypothetical protein
MRADRPFVFSNLKGGQGLDQIIEFVEQQGSLKLTKEIYHKHREISIYLSIIAVF